jgi:hypothetical protein
LVKSSFRSYTIGTEMPSSMLSTITSPTGSSTSTIVIGNPK